MELLIWNEINVIYFDKPCFFCFKRISSFRVLRMFVDGKKRVCGICSIIMYESPAD